MPTLIANNIGLITCEKTVDVVSKRLKLPALEQEEALKTNHRDHQAASTLTPYTPNIWEAVEQADLDLVRHYLETAGTDIVNSRHPTTGATLLHLAIATITTGKDMEQRLALMKLLINKGVDVTTCNLYGVQAIHMIPLHIPTASLPFIVTLLDGSQYTKPSLLINARDSDGWTPLHYAARFCQPPLPVMQTLVARGAKVNATDTNGHKSCLFGLLANGDYVDCFQWMVHTAKADIRLLGDFGDSLRGSLVLQAVKYGRLEVLQYMIHQPQLVNQLKSVISLDELDQARCLLQQQQMDDIDKEIQYLSLLLEHDTRSLVAKQSMGYHHQTTWLGKLRRAVLKRNH
ncbi:hypothetical protein BC941DRAFT_413341 [Chlamydoabsidia padenii]|nr:hypothetical protein BC941DRAFT_413341 [Chlamydoabsidia padenii]